MPKHNAFFYFMLDYKQRHEAEGARFHSLGQVSPVAGPVWEKMSAAQRKPYVDKARAGNAQGGKMTNVGIPYVELEAELNERETMALLKSSRIKSLVTDAAARNALETQDFYIISMAYFCVTTKGVYIPAELSVVRYSLESGVKEKWHTLINPGKLPLGMAYEAQMHADADHKLPLPPNGLGETDFDKIAVDLLAFLLKGDSVPLLFTDPDDIAKVDGMLRDILDEHVDGMELLVCSVTELTYQLKLSTEKYMMGQSNIPSVHHAQHLITKDVYEYTQGISCEYHERCEGYNACATSRCMRWSFIISDNCCLDMGITPVPGKHLPQNASVHSIVSMGDSVPTVKEDDKCSFVSGSNVSRLTFPEAEKQSVLSYASRDGDKGPGCSDSLKNMMDSYLKLKEGSVPGDETRSDLNSTLASTTSWGESVSQGKSRGRGSVLSMDISKSTDSNVRSAGRGRARLLDDFPPLGGAGRGRRFQ